MSAPTFNSYNKYVFYTNVTTAATFTSTSALTTSDATWIGVCKSESGYTIEKSVTEKDSLGNTRNIKRKLTIDMDFMTAIASAAKTALDGNNVALLLVNEDDATVDEGAGTFTLGTAADAILLYPAELEVMDDIKLGADVGLTKITGEAEKATKAELFKTISISNS